MIFIDTGALIARFLSKDQYHAQAIDIWKVIIELKEPCYTSNFVLNETFTLLGRRAGYGFAEKRARNIYASNFISIFRPGIEDELIALNFFKKFSDQKVSFTDCISFALMKKYQITTVFSFDRHFEWAGFQMYQQSFV